VAKRRPKTLDPDAVVSWLTSSFNGNGRKWLLAGVGEDDCGVIRIGDTFVVLSVDFLNATPIAEQLGVGRERVLGRLAVAATLSDLLGSGAVPRALLIAVTVPHGYPESLFKEVMRGAKRESDRWNVPVIGGDTKLGRGRSILTCGVGSVDSPDELFLANQARAGDLIFVSGRLGTCAAATSLGSRKRPIPRWAVSAITLPDLPMSRSRALAKLRIAHGGIDISDGLAADLRRMCVTSGVGAILEVEKIPTDPLIDAVARNEQVPAWAFSLASGGDFQFIVTAPPRARPDVEALGFTRIGVITSDRRLWIRSNNGVLCKLPEVGHKDRRGQLFADEIRRIVVETKRGISNAESD